MMLDWLSDNKEWMSWLGAASVVMFVASLVILPVLVVRIPSDYFRRHSPLSDRWRARHPALRVLFLVGKNLLGGVLVLLGIPMMPLPGQGLLTIIIGIMLLDFPGKRALERWLVGRPGVLRTINWMRGKAHRPPLLPPDPDPPPSPDDSPTHSHRV